MVRGPSVVSQVRAEAVIRSARRYGCHGWRQGRCILWSPYLVAMANCPEEVALELSRAALESQDGSENQLREKATAVLSAASIVVPVAAVALGSAPAGAAIPFGVAALAYLWCARSCGSALFPKDRQAGLLGGEMLQLVTETVADLPQMQASAARYLDGFYKHN